MGQEELYLKELVRYIHLNPIRADLVPDLAGLQRYRYCGHGALLGMSLSDLARAFGLSIPGISYAMRRGESLARSKNFTLEDCNRVI